VRRRPILYLKTFVVYYSCRKQTFYVLDTFTSHAHAHTHACMCVYDTSIISIFYKLCRAENLMFSDCRIHAKRNLQGPYFLLEELTVSQLVQKFFSFYPG
jgi:hypothetical protein